MTCPICDQKPMNCDCTPTEREQHSRVEELEAEIERLNGIIASLQPPDRPSLVKRLRRWTIATDAQPASDLMEEAADEIERLRGYTET